MNDKQHLRRSRSQGYFYRRRPDEIYIQNPQTHIFPHSSVEQLILTPELLMNGEEEREGDNILFSMRASPPSFEESPAGSSHSANESSSPRNFFLEKPPASWKSEETPISPGVTMLLSPASCFEKDGDEECVDLEVMNFFQTATYSGPRTFATNTRDMPRSLNAKKKKSTSKIGLPSPKTPKAWPSIVEPDISTLPSREVVERNILEAHLKLTGEMASNWKALDYEHSHCYRKDNPLEAYLVSPRPIRGRKQTRLPSSDVIETKMSPERGQCRSLPIDDRRRFVAAMYSLPPHTQQMRSSSNGNSNLKITRSKRGMLEPTSGIHGTISRTPSPVFDFDNSEITDIESDTEFDETGNERLSRCETLSSQDPHSPMFDKPPKPLEKDWKFRLQQDCPMGTLGVLESPSISFSANKPPSEISKPKNRKIDAAGLPKTEAMHLKDYTEGTHTTRPRQISSESSIRSPTSYIVPPPRRKSPPVIEPIHQDQMRETGASFEPESRTPRTLVSNWLSSISSNASRKEQSREQEVFWKKTRSWGRKSKPKLEGWI